MAGTRSLKKQSIGNMPLCGASKTRLWACSFPFYVSFFFFFFFFFELFLSNLKVSAKQLMIEKRWKGDPIKPLKIKNGTQDIQPNPLQKQGNPGDSWTIVVPTRLECWNLDMDHLIFKSKMIIGGWGKNPNQSGKILNSHHLNRKVGCSIKYILPAELCAFGMPPSSSRPRWKV